MNQLGSLLLLLILPLRLAPAADPPSPLLELNKLPYFLGRDYFVLRSGRAMMMLQADKADLGPAFTYLLFNVEDPRQSLHKDTAFNFVQNQGFGSSALTVELGGFPFTALGQRTETAWALEDGIPTVEAVWWAGGVRVRERLAALNQGVFRRRILVIGAHLVGEEAVTLKLGLPPGDWEQEGALLTQSGRGARLALGVTGRKPAHVDPVRGLVEIGPITLKPGLTNSVETLLFTQIPATEKAVFVGHAAACLASEASRETDSARRSWEAAASVKTEDRTVQEIFAKAQLSLVGFMSETGSMDAGPLEYGAQWVRDTSNTALGALMAGHVELARAALNWTLTKMVSQEGATMIAGVFEKPDLEQFDQMGELLHALREFRDWTGDDSLVRGHREVLLALVERPLQPVFRDQTGMVHNRREFWERTFDDAYELAYQTYVILGLREAIELAPALGGESRVDRWRLEADRIQQAVLHHPSRALVDGGRLVKRRNITGELADSFGPYQGFQPDVPVNTERHHRLLPDASEALPIALGIVDPRSKLARRTLDDLEQLWNTRWQDGGYDRYHTSAQPDQPGPWTFATCFILRAQHEANLWNRSRRSLEWLNTMAGGRTGVWFEEIPSIRSLEKACGLIPWTSAEIALFTVRDYLGIRFEHGAMVIHPALYPGSPQVMADLPYRGSRLHLEIRGAGSVMDATVNHTKLRPDIHGDLRLARDFGGGSVSIRTRADTVKPSVP